MNWLLSNSKRVLLAWVWLLVPPLAVIAVHVGISTYCCFGQAQLAWRRSLVQVAPDVAAQLNTARNEAKAFTLTAEQGDSIVEILGTKLQHMVQQGGFHLDSLSVEKSDVVNGLNQFHVALNGGGDVPALARFLHAVQTSERLLCLDYVRLSPPRGGDERSYSVELSFRYHVIPR